jgi:peptide/nickel transport system substrate-binding protein
VFSPDSSVHALFWRERRRPGRLITAAIVVALAAAACSSGSSSAATGQAAGTAGSSAGNTAGPPLASLQSLTVATSFAIDNLDPIDNGFWAPEFGYGDLLMKPVGNGKLEPWLLQSLRQTSANVWTLQLRPGITFQDGAPLDGSALAAAMSYSLAHNTSVQPDLPGAQVAATGPLTVTLTTSTATAGVPSLLANESMFPIFDTPKYVALKSKPDALVAARIYAGPYTVTSLTPEEMQMVPTPGYYGPKPTLHTLTVRFVKDTQARILAVEHGEADIALYPPTAAARQVKGRTDAYFLSQDPGIGYGGFRMILNLRSSPLNDLDVRQALLHGIDYAAISGQVLNGLYDTAVGLYPAYLPYAERDQNTDVAKATQLLDSDGWAPGAGGIRAKAGKPLRFTLLTYPQQPDTAPIALALQSQLKALGVDLQLRQVDDTTSIMKQPTGWDASLDGDSTLDWTGTDPVQPLVDHFTTGGNNNYGGISDPQIDQLAKQLGGITDDGQRQPLLQQAQHIIVDEKAYSIYVTIKRDPVIVGPKLRGYKVPRAALLWTNAFG